MAKSCISCGKNHRNRVTDLCNDCRVTPTYPLCKCLKHHVYYGTSCKDCFRCTYGQLQKELKTYSFV